MDLELVTFLSFLVAMVTTTVEQCPITVCSCQQYPPDIKVINCRDKNLQELPKIENPSMEYAYKVTFSTSHDTSTNYCSTCNRIEYLPDNAFLGIRITSLDLSKNPIRFIANGAFNGIEQELTELYISGDKSSSPNYFAFRNLSELLILELEEFNQAYIDVDNNFQSFPKLQKLVLKSMNLSYIGRYSFAKKLKSLQRFELIDNPKLETIPIGALRYLTTLTHLILKSNNIKTVPYAAFSELYYLQELDLSENSISNLDSGCFKHIQNTLYRLKLHINKLDENKLYPLSDGYWTVLKELNLARNELARIPENLFVNMVQLTYIYLNSNKLTSIQKSDFRALTKLKELDLSLNQLVYIQSESFLGLQSLTFLDLREQNQWNKYLKLNITRDSVRGLENVLEELLLTRSLVVEISLWDAVAALKRLRILQLGKTGLTSIKDYAFKDHSYLQYLDLSENKLFELDDTKFFGLEDSLLTLDLSQNNIRLIDECVLKQFSKLGQMYLWQNPLHCDCRLAWLYDWIEAKKQKDPFIIYTADPICDTPSDLHKSPIYQLQRSDLKCDQNYIKPLCITPSPTTYPTTKSTTTNYQPKMSTISKTNDTPAHVPVPNLDVKLDKRESTRLTLMWKVSQIASVDKYLLSFHKDDGNSFKMVFPLDKTVNYFVLNRLDPNSYYEMCINVILINMNIPGPKKCIFDKTQSTSDGNPKLPNTHCLTMTLLFIFIFKYFV